VSSLGQGFSFTCIGKTWIGIFVTAVVKESQFLAWFLSSSWQCCSLTLKSVIPIGFKDHILSWLFFFFFCFLGCAFSVSIPNIFSSLGFSTLECPELTLWSLFSSTYTLRDHGFQCHLWAEDYQLLRQMQGMPIRSLFIITKTWSNLNVLLICWLFMVHPIMMYNNDVPCTTMVQDQVKLCVLKGGKAKYRNKMWLYKAGFLYKSSSNCLLWPFHFYCSLYTKSIKNSLSYCLILCFICLGLLVHPFILIFFSYIHYRLLRFECKANQKFIFL
jgi:hypothetical protein